jgi:hypothetical protein
VSNLSLPPIQAYHPTTFQERGVLIPFTTPLLGGTRARPGEKAGLELVIPNPSGGPGVYIMDWSAISDLCRPTLHDRQLSERIAAIPNVVPSAIRRVAREVAAEGLAGEEAMQAALATADAEKQDRTVTNFLLLMALVDQVALFKDAPKGVPDMETRARLTVARIAPGIGRSADWVATALESLGDAMAALGVAGQPTLSRVPRLIDLLGDTCASLGAWSRNQKDADQASYVEMINTTASHTLALARDTTDRGRGLTKNLTELLRRWAADSDSGVRLAARPEWLLDGWEQICLIWRCARDDASRRAALIEIAQLVPIIPLEAFHWSDIVIELDVATRVRRNIPLNEDWRTGAIVFDLIARNESIRAAAC